jgi:L-amino acid N-acyltransferase YncA
MLSIALMHTSESRTFSAMDRIRLADPTDIAGDAVAIAAIYAPHVTGSAISFELEPPTAAEMAARIAAVLPIAPWLVLERAGGVAGYAYAARHRDRAAYQWSVDASVYVRADHMRRSVGRALYTSLFALLRVQGFHAVHAGATLPNPASVGLHESMGFRAIGVYPAVGFKHGAWHDVSWWQLRIRDRADLPSTPPRPRRDAEDDPAWPDALASGLDVLVRR